MTEGLDLAQAWRSGLAVAAEFLCLGAAGAGAAALMWALLDPVDARPATVARTTPPPLPAVLPGPDPFFRSGALEGGPETAAASGYVLHATRVTGDARASAILSWPDAPQAAFRVGDPLSGGARLAEVAHDHVVIERDGQRQRVTFPATPAILPPPPHLERTERAAPLAQSPAPGFAEAGLTRVERPGQPAGYAVGGGSPLAAAGFAPGDVLIDVDGRGLSPETVAGLRERVMSGAPLEIRFERNGQIMTKRFGNGAP